MSSPQTPSPIARRQEDTTSTPPPRNPFSTSIQDPVITMSGVRASSSRIRPRGSFSFRSSPTVALSVSGGENWRMSEREVAQAAAMEDSDDEPLDGEEGIVVQDEACYVEDWNGKVDFLSSLPHEISLYILLHLALPSLIATTQVSPGWRQLALDNLVWRDLFHREKRWRVREDLGETTLRRSGYASGSGPSSRRSSIAAKKHIAGSVVEGMSGSRLGKRLSDLISDLGTLTLTPLDRRRLTPVTPAFSQIHESSGEEESESEENNSTATPRRPASGITSLPFAVAPILTNDNSSSGLSSLATSFVALASASTPGPFRYASSSTLSPLGPVPSPSLGWTPIAPLFLDWPKLYRERFILDQRWKAGSAENRELKGHSDSVYCLQFDEGKIVTGSRDHTIRVWETKTGKCTRTLLGHSASVLCLQYDSKILVSGSSDCRVLVWDLVGEEGTGAGKWEVKQSLLGHTMGVLDLCFDDDWVVSCSKDTTIRVWHKATGELYRTLSGHRGPVNAVQLLKNKIVSASGDSFMKLWDVLTGEIIRVYSGHERGLACVQYSPSGKIIASGSNDKFIKIWDAETGECLRTLAGHTDLVRTLAFDETRRRLISGSYDKTIRTWDLDTGEALLTFKAHSSLIFDVSFSASKILSCSHDQKIVILDFGVGLDVSKFV